MENWMYNELKENVIEVFRDFQKKGFGELDCASHSIEAFWCFEDEFRNVENLILVCTVLDMLLLNGNKVFSGTINLFNKLQLSITSRELEKGLSSNELIEFNNQLINTLILIKKAIIIY